MSGKPSQKKRHVMSKTNTNPTPGLFNPIAPVALSKLRLERNRASVTHAPPSLHYRLNVNYAPLPSREQLGKEFLGNLAVPEATACFDGRAWKKHASCLGMVEKPGEKFFLLKNFGCPMESDEAVIGWGSKNGYRPATHLEAYEFVKAYPKLLEQESIIALGSYAFEGEERIHAIMFTADVPGFVGITMNAFSEIYRFLFVFTFEDQDLTFIQTTWKTVVEMSAGDEVYLVMAVIKADNLLDYALKSLGMAGDTFDIRLKLASAKYPGILNVRKAHFLRNEMVHKAEFILDPVMARLALRDFKDGLQLLKVL
jgi:hypothetical protein